MNKWTPEKVRTSKRRRTTCPALLSHTWYENHTRTVRQVPTRGYDRHRYRSRGFRPRRCDASGNTLTRGACPERRWCRRGPLHGLEVERRREQARGESVSEGMTSTSTLVSRAPAREAQASRPAQARTPGCFANTRTRSAHKRVHSIMSNVLGTASRDVVVSRATRPPTHSLLACRGWPPFRA